MTALHPAAQSILDAYQSELTVEDGLAAVVEKIADIKYPDSPNPKWYEPVRQHLHNQMHRKDLLQLARLLREDCDPPSSTKSQSPTNVDCNIEAEINELTWRQKAARDCVEKKRKPSLTPTQHLPTCATVQLVNLKCWLPP